MLRLSLQLHKWIGLAVGIQVLFWVLGGLIMTALPIEQVRGEQHIAHRAQAPIDLARAKPVTQMVQEAGYDTLGEATLKSTPRGAIWVLSSASGGEAWYDAYTGENVSEITADQARRAAVAAYEGAGRPIAVKLLDEAPQEAQVGGPLWQVVFSDPERTRLYLNVFTGEVESRRSNLWRFYDFFYRLHIMNFGASQNYNHPTIIIVTAFTLAIVVTGFILLWVRVGRDLRNLRARRSKAPAA